MKKLLLSAAFIAVSFISFAQQGSWYIGGNAGFSSNQTKLKNGTDTFDQPKLSSWTLSPEIGTFLSDNLSVGVALNIGGEKTEKNDAINAISKSVKVGGTAYSRYFFGSNAFRPFVGVNVTVLPGNTTVSSSFAPDVKGKTMDFGANLNAGFAFALSPSVTVVGSFGALGFSQSIKKQDGSDIKEIKNNFGFNAETLGERFNIGFYYTFLK